MAILQFRKRVGRLEERAKQHQQLDEEIVQLLKELGISQFTPSATGAVIVYHPDVTTPEEATRVLQPFIPDLAAVICLPANGRDGEEQPEANYGNRVQPQ